MAPAPAAAASGATAGAASAAGQGGAAGGRNLFGSTATMLFSATTALQKVATHVTGSDEFGEVAKHRPQLELLKQRLSDPKLDRSRGREYLVRLIYCEMLGHDASFAYVKALQFASDNSIHTKKVCLHHHGGVATTTTGRPCRT